MHVLFVHKNFPAQFGHIGRHLVDNHGFGCSFVCELPSADLDGIERIQYKIAGGATRDTHYCSRTFENATWAPHSKLMRPSSLPMHAAHCSLSGMIDNYLVEG